MAASPTCLDFTCPLKLYGKLIALFCLHSMKYRPWAFLNIFFTNSTSSIIVHHLRSLNLDPCEERLECLYQPRHQWQASHLHQTRNWRGRYQLEEAMIYRPLIWTSPPTSWNQSNFYNGGLRMIRYQPHTLPSGFLFFSPESLPSF